MASVDQNIISKLSEPVANPDMGDSGGFTPFLPGSVSQNVVRSNQTDAMSYLAGGDEAGNVEDSRGAATLPIGSGSGIFGSDLAEEVGGNVGGLVGRTPEYEQTTADHMGRVGPMYDFKNMMQTEQAKLTGGTGDWKEGIKKSVGEVKQAKGLKGKLGALKGELEKWAAFG